MFGQSLARTARALNARALSTVTEHQALSLEHFSEHFNARPVIYRGGCATWPATERWLSMDYLKERAGHVNVPVEIGESYNALTEHVEMPFSLYLDYLSLAPEEETVDPSQLAYMAQAQVSPLTDPAVGDVEVPELCKLGRGDQYATMLWLGPKGTVSPLHQDPYHNCLCQLRGSKRLILFHPDQRPNLYPSADPLQPNTSLVDPEKPDLDTYPLFPAREAVVAELHPGDMLYIPRKWWHHVRSLSKSSSVSFWWL